MLASKEKMIDFQPRKSCVSNIASYSHL